MLDANQTWIVGIGNALRGDDGVGPFVARRIAALSLPNVQVLAVHQLLPEFAPVISTAARVIFVDATPSALAGDLPRCSQIASTDIRRSLSHQLTPTRLLALTESATDRRPEAWLVTIPVTHVGIGDGLSAAARRTANLAIGMIRNQFFLPHATSGLAAVP